MLVDFCHHCLGSKIKTDKVSFDGYEVSNLLSGDHLLKNKGFLADHFIKPPVNVTVEFPCNITIYRLVIDPVIGRQQSCDIKIFTGTKTISKSWLYGNDDKCPVDSDGLLLNSVGFVTLSEPNVICFKNSFFRERFFWKIDNMADSDQYPVRSELKGRKPGSLTNVSHVNICVTRAKSGGTVAMKRLEVWGMPASSVPFSLQQNLLGVYSKALQPDAGRQGKVKGDKNADASVQQSEQTQDNSGFVLQDDVKIPEDFIDQITFEVMSVPMLLPCGKNIDQSSLERFVNTEASWGRPPSDPFTGVVFSPGHQVIPNLALKARLDQFLLRNSHKIKVARTLGRPESTAAKHEMKSSRLVSDNRDINKLRDTVLPSSLKCSSAPSADRNFSDKDRKVYMFERSVISDTTDADIPNRVKRRKMEDACIRHEASFFGEKRPTLAADINVAPKHLNISDAVQNTDDGTVVPSTLLYRRSGDSVEKLRKCKDSVSFGKRPKRKVEDDKKQSTDLVSDVNPLKHTRTLATSLDSALSDVLSNLPTFTTFSSAKHVNSGPDMKILICCFCQSHLNNDQIIKYILPCKHYACRKCIQQQKTCQCETCNTKFSSEQLTRVF